MIRDCEDTAQMYADPLVPMENAREKALLRLVLVLVLVPSARQDFEYWLAMHLR